MKLNFKKMRSEWKDMTEVKNLEVSGLDVGSFSVKLVHLRSGIGGHIAVAAYKVDIGITEQDDERARSIKTAAAIRTCFEQSRIESRHVVCGVCGPEVAVRPFSFPALPAEEINQAIMLEAEQVCPFDVGKNILEYQLINQRTEAEGDDVSGVIVAATNDVIRSKVGLVSNASLNCALMDVDGLALVNCFERTMRKEHGRDAHATCLLNVGHTFTNLVVMQGKKPPFIRDILHGGSEIIEHIAASRNLTREAAARAVADRSDDENVNYLAGGAAALVSEINESLRYYMREQRLQTIDNVLVCGGFSLVKGFVELLRRSLPFGAELWNPFEHIGRQPATADLEILEKSGPAFAVAAGLAMRTI